MNIIGLLDGYEWIKWILFLTLFASLAIIMYRGVPTPVNQKISWSPKVSYSTYIPFPLNSPLFPYFISRFYFRAKVEEIDDLPPRQNRPQSPRDPPQAKERLQNQNFCFRSVAGDPGVPAMLPMREQLIEKMREERAKEIAQKAARKAMNTGASMDMEDRSWCRTGHWRGKNGPSRSSSSIRFRFLRHPALPESAEFADATQNIDSSRRAFYREFKEVFETADVLLMVLDARDPQGVVFARLKSKSWRLGVRNALSWCSTRLIWCQGIMSRAGSAWFNGSFPVSLSRHPPRRAAPTSVIPPRLPVLRRTELTGFSSCSRITRGPGIWAKVACPRRGHRVPERR